MISGMMNGVDTSLGESSKNFQRRNSKIENLANVITLRLDMFHTLHCLVIQPSHPPTTTHLSLSLLKQTKKKKG